jgi:deoxyribonuclease V
MRTRSNVSFPRLPDLNHELDLLIAQVPAGFVTTFGDLARALGSRHAAIWVSQWVSRKAEAEPGIRQRVVAKAEAAGRRRFDQFQNSPPLATLRDWLQRAAKTVGDEPLAGPVRTVAGIDVAYPTPTEAVGVAVLVDASSREVLHQAVVRRRVEFPYITGYLSFRELPVMAAALEELRLAGTTPDVVMIDGQGRLHPERAGIATGFAAITSQPTIGVAKSLLKGKVEQGDESSTVRRVLIDDEHLGWAVRGAPRAASVYLSVGGWLTLDDVLAVTQPFLGRIRLPLPTHLADALSKKEARGKARA